MVKQKRNEDRREKKAVQFEMNCPPSPSSSSALHAVVLRAWVDLVSFHAHHMPRESILYILSFITTTTARAAPRRAARSRPRSVSSSARVSRPDELYILLYSLFSNLLLLLLIFSRSSILRVSFSRVNGD